MLTMFSHSAGSFSPRHACNTWYEKHASRKTRVDKCRTMLQVSGRRSWRALISYETNGHIRCQSTSVSFIVVCYLVFFYDVSLPTHEHSAIVSTTDRYFLVSLRDGNCFVGQDNKLKLHNVFIKHTNLKNEKKRISLSQIYF